MNFCRCFLLSILILTALLSDILIAFQQVAFTPDSSPPERVILDSRTSVPMHVVRGSPIVDVQVNGKGPFRFGIETGANFIAVTRELVSKLALPRTGGQEDFPAYHLDQLSVGDAIFEEMIVYVSRFAQTDIDGILGLPVYRNLLLTLDYGKQRVVLERGELPTPNERDILPLLRIGSFWGIQMAIGEKHFVGVIDTRSPSAFGISPRMADTLSFEGQLRPIGTARGAGIPEATIRSGRLAEDIVIGAYLFPKPSVTVRAVPPSLPKAPVVGTQILQQFVVTLDQAQQRIRLSRSGGNTIDISTQPRGTIRDSLHTPSSSADVSSTVLSAYVGIYDDREILLDGEKLYIRRGGRSPIEMVWTGADTFGLVGIPQAQIKFVRDANQLVTRISVLNPQGEWETVERSTPQQLEKPQGERPLTHAEVEVRRLEREWLDSYEKRDTNAMSQILADEFKLTFSNGSVQTKADILAQLQSERASGSQPPKFSTEDVQSRVEGDSVILTGRFIQQMERNGQIRTMQMRYKDTYSKRQGRWRVIASELTRIQR